MQAMQLCWFIEPVDGAKEYIKRNQEITVNSAMVTDGKTKFCDIYVRTTINLGKRSLKLLSVESF